MTDKVSFNLNKFFRKIVLKKQHIKKLRNKIYLLDNTKKRNYKTLNLFIIFFYVFTKFFEFFR